MGYFVTQNYVCHFILKVHEKREVKKLREICNKIAKIKNTFKVVKNNIL